MGGICEKIEKALLHAGASQVGFANLSSVPSDERLGYAYGISILVALDPRIINDLNKGVSHEYEREYMCVNAKLDSLARLGANILQNHGYTALPQTTTQIVIDDKMATQLPHKTVATRAGLGWIGKSALLTTPTYGSAIRITTILTNAKLEVGKSIDQSYCGECNRCVTNCPGKAVKGFNWDIEKKRSAYYDNIECRKETRRRSGLNNIHKSLCGICILSCPYTQKYIEEHNLIYNGFNIDFLKE